LILTAKAFNDIAQARDWYERQLPGLGIRFTARIDETIAAIESNPLAFQILVDDARRANVPRFPYGVWYVIAEQPIVIACLHHKRSAAVLQGRIPA
jgi:toxin ParE1/3/4